MLQDSRAPLAADDLRNSDSAELRGRRSDRLVERRRSWLRFRRALPWLTPSLVGVGIFFFTPAISVMWLAMQHWNLVNAPQFAGFDPLFQAVGDMRFWHSATLTIAIAAIVTCAELTGGFGLALVLVSWPRLSAVGQVVLLVPWALAPLIVGIIARWVFAPSSGLISQVVGRRVDWISEPLLAPLVVASVVVWQGVGFIALLYAAALRAIPAELRAAATLDGANRWAVIRHIELPLVRRTTLFLAMTIVVQVFSLYDLIVPLTGGGPGTATTTLSFLIVQVAWVEFDIGGAAAMSVVTVAMMSIILLALSQVLKDSTR